MTSIWMSCKSGTKTRSRFYIYGSGDHQLISIHDKVPNKQDVRFHPVLSPNIDKEISTVSSLSANNILASKTFHPKDTERHKNKFQHKHSSKGILLVQIQVRSTNFHYYYWYLKLYKTYQLFKLTRNFYSPHRY